MLLKSGANVDVPQEVMVYYVEDSILMVGHCSTPSLRNKQVGGLHDPTMTLLIFCRGGDRTKFYTRF